ncbi:UDP-4-amino-4,6-dideoxy-N-acetyl-beta-L-altrosamine transaminase [uncultured Microbulbifer sp.]|uniref:UDP-4-amino-4, 6-dideoxy-N-acetyl-beta-L-altrosamine transaminase n=1 Tax=uncultured Microbulbifer sp. TaxID=348147 RepID=UPI0026106C1E|nr:UDP-4-amino-4,6-dideoxy-N-acetyl-beta-L-altrosamine transaminase [uncultured Microbulbifer sp.]
MIPYGRQDITRADIDAVIKVLTSDFLTQGPMVPHFEKSVASYVGVRYAIAVNSATSALHISCLALGLGSGDTLWTSPITFVASANCALYCGAKVDFIDIDPRTYNICPILLEKKLIEAEEKECLPKVIVAVHLCGQSCEMEKFWLLGQRFGFKIIEDASHAIGGKYKNYFIGNCRFSDITVFSFHPVKIITTAEGGMAVTNENAVAEKLALLRSHGITRDVSMMSHESDGPWYYQQIELGFNYRMTELQAALGVSQLKRLDSFVVRRHELAARYNELLKDFPIKTPWQNPDNYSGYHLYVIRLEVEKLSVSHRQIFELLREDEIGVNLHYIPVHTQPYYQNLGFRVGDFPEAERYYCEAISLPLYHGMTDAQQDTVRFALGRAIGL